MRGDTCEHIFQNERAEPQQPFFRIDQRRRYRRFSCGTAVSPDLKPYHSMLCKYRRNHVQMRHGVEWECQVHVYMVGPWVCRPCWFWNHRLRLGQLVGPAGHIFLIPTWPDPHGANMFKSRRPHLLWSMDAHLYLNGPAFYDAPFLEQADKAAKPLRICLSLR